MMTIDEAIAHAEWAANNCEGECSEDHRQLAEWLKELRQWQKLVEGIDLRPESMMKPLQPNVDDLERENDRLKDEHAKLRKLLQEAVNLQLEDCGDCWGGLCEECECWVADSEGELRALGIEVSDD